jgi:hypothetical protein
VAHEPTLAGSATSSAAITSRSFGIRSPASLLTCPRPEPGGRPGAPVRPRSAPGGARSRAWVWSADPAVKARGRIDTGRVGDARPEQPRPRPTRRISRLTRDAHRAVRRPEGRPGRGDLRRQVPACRV